MHRSLALPNPTFGKGKPRSSGWCLKACVVFFCAALVLITYKTVYDPFVPVDISQAVRIIVNAVHSDRNTFQKIFRDAGAGALLESEESGSRRNSVAAGPHGTGIDAPFAFLKDERAHYGHVNYQSTRPNDNLQFRRVPCANAEATASNRRGVDILTDFVETGYKTLGCPLSTSCIDLPTMPAAKTEFVKAAEQDPTCSAALLNVVTAIALGQESVDDTEFDRYFNPLVNDNGVHAAVRAKAWLMRGVAMERVGRSAAHEYDMVRRLWPKFCVQYSSFKCNTRFFPWRLLSDPAARTEAGRTAEKNAVLRMLLTSEFQSVHLGLQGNVTEADAKAFPTRHFVVIRHLMSGYGLAMHQYSWLVLINTNSIPFGDPQVRTRYGHANDAPSNLMRGMLNEAVEGLIGVPIKPTYSYFGGYREGSVLSPHTDRLACEFTLSMTLYTDPPQPWGFLIDSRAITVAPAERGGARPRPDTAHLVNITLYDGDAGIIRGRKVVHFRDAYEVRIDASDLFLLNSLLSRLLLRVNLLE